MKVKVYKVLVRGEEYFVDAPNKRVAKWCGLNLFNNEYMPEATIKDVEKN